MPSEKTRTLALALAAAATALAGGATIYIISRRRTASRRVHLASRAELVAVSAQSGCARCLLFPTPATVRLSAVSDFDGADDLVRDLTRVRAIALDLACNRGLASARLAVPRLSSLREVSLARCGLATLPSCLTTLPQLTVLDVSGKELVALDGGVLASLPKLVKLNAAANRLRTLPPEIGRLAKLRLLGLRDNMLRTLPDEVGELKELRELYVTSNRLTSLPSTLGRCRNLRKLQASFNALRTLPSELAELPNLEMVRVAGCEIFALPPALASAPRLCWVSLAGNPLTSTPPPHAATVPHAVVPGVEALDYTASKKLGDGASGDVRVAVWAGAPAWVGTSTVAVKLFHASAPSPDGHPADEAAIARVVDHPALARAVATVVGVAVAPSSAGDDDASPPPSPGEGEDDDAAASPAPPSPPPPAGLLFRVVPGVPLADKPRGEPRLLRCTWAADKKIAPPAALRAAARLAGGLAALHASGIAHGDVYAHNVLCDEEGAATLVDLGAAFLCRQVVMVATPPPPPPPLLPPPSTRSTCAPLAPSWASWRAPRTGGRRACWRGRGGARPTRAPRRGRRRPRWRRC